MARSCMRALLLVLLPLAIVGCAQGMGGNSGDDDDDDTPRVDARINTPDAAVSIDARIVDAPMTPIDAPVSLPDAPAGADGGGLFCNSTAECSGTPGTCCFFLVQPPGFCVPGAEIAGVCLPS